MSSNGQIGAIILARMDSRRLPGKVLAEAGGQTLLAHVANQIPRECLDAVPILATSARAVDDPLVEEARRLGLAVFRGDTEDVAGRFIAAASEARLEAAFRVNADSPFLAPRLFGEAVALWRAGAPDLVTNLAPRSFPYGVSIELVRIAALRALLDVSADRAAREHVTSLLYARLPSERVLNILDEGAPIEGEQTRLRLTIDEPDDLATFRRYLENRHDRSASLCYRSAAVSGLFAR